MDEILLKAIHLLLEQIDQVEVVEDLLLIEVDWGDLLSPKEDEIFPVKFQASEWTLAYTQSELVLRFALSQAMGEHVIIVYHGGNSFQLPLDIRARAHNKTPYHLGLRHRLHAITNRDWPPEMDYVDWRPSVLAHLDDLIRLSGGTDIRIWSITRSDLEELLVQANFGLKIQGQRAPQILAEIVAIQRRNPAMPDTLILSLLKDQLRQQSIEGADLIGWAAEKPGRAEEIVRTGLMMAAEQAANLMPNWAGLNQLRALLVNERKLSENQAVIIVTELATTALTQLHPSTRLSILKNAHDDLANVLPAETYNPWFPTLLEKESLRLAERLATGDPQAAVNVTRLHEHLLATEYRSRLDALDEMAILVTRWQSQLGIVKEQVSVVNWATWYTEQGARLDLSVLRLMACLDQGTGLEGPIRTLLQSYWGWRDQCSFRFAAEYIAHYEAAIHDRKTGIFGTHRLLNWIIRPFLQPGKRVLVIVMDGMSFADYYHLLDQWAQKSPKVYGQMVGPTLSLLPSVTAVSRKAIFLNALPTDRLDDDETYEKKAAVSEKQALQQAFPDYKVLLFNKTNLDDQQIFNDIQFCMADLLAVIINTIDDDLKNATTKVRLPTLDDLGPLVQIVRRGIEAGWQVLLTTDHGHTWHRDKKLRRGEIQPGGGERFVLLSGNQLAPEDAVETKDPHILYEPDDKRLGLLTAWGAYFGHNPHRGYHGGASLEEVVLPCAQLSYQAPSNPDQSSHAPVLEASSLMQEAAYDLNGVVLTLPDRKMVTLNLPFALKPIEIKLLQTLAHFGEASEAQLKQSVGSRRISGPLANLRDQMAEAGMDLIEHKGMGPDGAVYRFRQELVK